ncbi:hypothetical protein [Phytobacter diazotrophicus]|uniref:hypothetical protein n=1 Tax=Phytobacter diazotrophicus TaxID=395631 RepID=UPI002FF574A9
MTEDNVASYALAKQKQADTNLDELKVVKRFTSRHVKPKDLVDDVKRQLKARDIKYRITLSSLDLTGFDKKAVIIFPEVRLIFEFVLKPNADKQVEGWIVEQLKCSTNKQPIDYITFIINKISEIKKNGQTTAKT